LNAFSKYNFARCIPQDPLHLPFLPNKVGVGDASSTISLVECTAILYLLEDVLANEKAPFFFRKTAFAYYFFFHLGRPETSE
jgi:hypothetical protein